MTKYLVIWFGQEGERESEEFVDYYDALDLLHELRDNGTKCKLKKVAIADIYAAV